MKEHQNNFLTINEFTELWVQPYTDDNLNFYLLVCSSIFLLAIKAIFFTGKNAQLSASFFSIALSEQESFGLFKQFNNQVAHQIVLLLFAAIQVWYLAINLFMLPEFTTINFLPELIIFGVIFLLLALKFLLYNTIKFVGRSSFDFQYFIENYLFALFFLSVYSFIVYLVYYYYPAIPLFLLLIIGTSLVYIWLLLRMFFIGNRDRTLRSVYFFLYLCTLEIAPLVFIIA